VDEAVATAKSDFALQQVQKLYEGSTFELVRARVRLVYESSLFQYFVASLIVLGFIQDVVESCMKSDDEAVISVFFWVEVGVTFFYTLELLCNMFVNSENCFQAFYSLPQNWIDFLVVIASLVSIMLSLVQAGHNVPIKMVRVVRVLNLAKFLTSFETMNRMVSCLAYSALPLMNAFVLLLVLTIIWAVMGTGVLGERSPEFFGSFQSSLFSLFQVLSGDSWASQIAREMFFLDEEGMRVTDTALAFYFIRSTYTQPCSRHGPRVESARTPFFVRTASQPAYPLPYKNTFTHIPSRILPPPTHTQVPNHISTPLSSAQNDTYSDRQTPLSCPPTPARTHLHI